MRCYAAGSGSTSSEIKLDRYVFHGAGCKPRNEGQVKRAFGSSKSCFKIQKGLYLSVIA